MLIVFPSDSSSFVLNVARQSPRDFSTLHKSHVLSLRLTSRERERAVGWMVSEREGEEEEEN